MEKLHAISSADVKQKNCKLLHGKLQTFSLNLKQEIQNNTNYVAPMCDLIKKYMKLIEI